MVKVFVIKNTNHSAVHVAISFSPFPFSISSLVCRHITILNDNNLPQKTILKPQEQTPPWHPERIFHKHHQSPSDHDLQFSFWLT